MGATINSSGYKVVNLKRKIVLIHRLIAQAFIPNPEKKRCINHKDGVKTNNSLKNLEWCTYKENSVHALATGLREPTQGEKIGCSKLTEKDIKKIRMLKKTNPKIKGLELAEMFNIDGSQISRVLSKKIWAHVK